MLISISKTPRYNIVFINQGQMRTDRYATYGGLIGGAASFTMGYKAAPGLILGLIAGCFTAGFVINPRENNANKNQEK